MTIKTTEVPLEEMVDNWEAKPSMQRYLKTYNIIREFYPNKEIKAYKVEEKGHTPIYYYQVILGGKHDKQ